MKKKKKHAPLQDLFRGYIRVISVAMLLQIQTNIHTEKYSPKSYVNFHTQMSSSKSAEAGNEGKRRSCYADIQ